PPSAAKMREYRPQTTTSQSSVSTWLGSVTPWLGSVTPWLGSVNPWPGPTGGRPARALSCSADQRPHGSGLLERLRQGAQQALDTALGAGPAERERQCAPSLLSGQARRGQDGAGLSAPGRAGRSRRGIHTALVAQEQQRIGVRAGEDAVD